MKHRIKLHEFEDTDETYKTFWFQSKNGVGYDIMYMTSIFREKEFIISISYSSMDNRYETLETIRYKKFSVKIFEKAIYKLYKKYYL